MKSGLNVTWSACLIRKQGHVIKPNQKESAVAITDSECCLDDFPLPFWLGWIDPSFDLDVKALGRSSNKIVNARLVNLHQCFPFRPCTKLKRFMRRLKTAREMPRLDSASSTK